jgi:ubiquinone/menaquinone biosynthesis C-methylase UbiE
MICRRANTARCVMSSYNDRVEEYRYKLFLRYEEQEALVEQVQNGTFEKMANIVEQAVQGLSHPKIIDIASGRGLPAGAIAKALPNASVLSTDLSSNMNKEAEEKFEDLYNFKTALVNMEDMNAFGDNKFDVATCCYGYMYVNDKAKALAETFRILKPGGTLVATVWTEIPVVKSHEDDYQHSRHSSMLLSLADIGLFEKLLHQAGFTHVRADFSTHHDFDLTTSEEIKYGFSQLELYDDLVESGQEEAAQRVFDELVKASPRKDNLISVFRGHYTSKLVTAKKVSSSHGTDSIIEL